MRIAKCEGGHYFDADQFDECPHCGVLEAPEAEDIPIAGAMGLHPITMELFEEPGVPRIPVIAVTGVALNIGKRSSQQDAAKVARKSFADREAVLGIVCDGIGGSAGGGIASALSTELFLDDFNDLADDDMQAFLLREVHRLDERIAALKNDDEEPLRTGTTLVAAMVYEGELYWVSVGDSRAYILREGELAQITVDHNYGMILQSKVDKGLVSEEILRDHTEKEKLISYIGYGGLRYIDQNGRPMPLLPDDVILLCSDGVYRTLGDDWLAKFLSVGLPAQEIAEGLVKAVLQMEKENQDNMSAVVIQIKAWEGNLE